MLELEVGIWSFEGCVSFLCFPRPANPLAPKTENPPRRQSDHAECMWRSSRCQMPEGRRAGPASASGHRVQRTDAFGFVFHTVPLPAKLLRSRVYKPGPWL